MLAKATVAAMFPLELQFPATQRLWVAAREVARVPSELQFAAAAFVQLPQAGWSVVMWSAVVKVVKEAQTMAVQVLQPPLRMYWHQRAHRHIAIATGKLLLEDNFHRIDKQRV